MDRRTFNNTLVGALTTTMVGCAVPGRSEAAGRTVLYQGVGEKLTQWNVDVEAATLTPRATLILPSALQYAWPHPSHRYLYACTSDQQAGMVDKIDRLCAMRIGADGALSMHGEPQALVSRPINNSVDATGSYVLTCYNNPANLSVHRINQDGTLGAKVDQAARLDVGIFPHQIRTTPTNHSVILVTRGNNATRSKPEDPGALKVFSFTDGQLSPLENIQVGGKGGIGYGPRHLDFHPTQPWVYVSLERENQIQMHRRTGDTLVPEPAYIKKTTAGDYVGSAALLTLAGAIHVHPNGRHVYVSNRASITADFNGQQVFAGGENNVAVFSLDSKTGEPTLIQNAAVPSFHPRTFSIDPSGRLLVTATTANMLVREGSGVRKVPPSLSVYRIATDGRLSYVRNYDVELSGQTQQMWVGMLALPA